MSVAYSFGLSLLLDGWKPSEPRWSEFLRFVATAARAPILRNHARMDAMDLDGISRRIFVAEHGAVRVIGPTAPEFGALSAALSSGASMPADFAVYVEDLMEADIIVPTLPSSSGITLQAAAFADILRLEGRTELTIRDSTWATAIATELASQAGELKEECPEDGADLEEFCRSFLRDVEIARRLAFPLSVAVE